MKFKIYEVERVRDDGKDEHKLQFWYLDYADAVERFKKLVEEEKKVDWIEEALATKDADDIWYQSELTEEVDCWCIAVDYHLDRMYSAVTITEREVF